jgi:hypothetical protein
MIKRHKPTRVRAWPELVDFLPSLTVLKEPGNDSGSVRPIHIDFGSVRAVTSTGLTVFLLRLLRLLKDRPNPVIRDDCPEVIRSELEQLRAFHILNSKGRTFQRELRLASVGAGTPPTTSRFSLPVFSLSFDGSKRRKTVNAFSTWLLDQLLPLEDVYKFRSNGFVMLLNEIAKNSEDHAKADALFGFDIIPITNEVSKLTFAFGDVGVGIKQHIQAHLPPEEESRRKHMSLYEAYRLALKPGYTSNRGSGLNRGHGMSIIVDNASSMKLHLSVFDAQSRGLLTDLAEVEKNSHSAIRRIFHKVGHDVGFFYFGETYMSRKHK